jgi:hypothetical protein
MLYLLDVVSILCCLLIACQDFLRRELSLYPLLVLFASLLTGSILRHSWIEALTNVSWILLFLAANLLLLQAYFSLKTGKAVLIVNRQLGLGDIVFFAAVSAAFGVANFIFYFLSGLLLTMALTLLTALRTRKPAGEIPLAGYMAVVFIGFIALSYSTEPGLLYSSSFVLNLLAPLQLTAH